MSFHDVALLRKLAEASLRPHQERVVEKVSLQPTLAVHSLGSGKTLTALQSILEAKRDNPGKKALVVAPASLGQNIWKEVEKHGLPLSPSDVTVISYEALARNPEKYNSSDYNIVVVDEIHRIRNTGTKMKTSLDSTLLSASDARVLGLTATPVFNKPEDLGVIVNTISRKKILPEDAKSFANQFVALEKYEPGFFARLGGATPGVTTRLKNMSALEHALRGRVDYFDAKSDPDYLKMFPSSTEKEVMVTMTPEQQAVYQYLEGKIPRNLRVKINKGLPLSKQEASELNAFLTGVRQAANTPVEYMTDPALREKHYISPKIQRIAEDFDNSYRASPGFKGVVYSNYLKSGLNPAKDALVNKGYKAEVFSGELSAKEKKKLIDSYNSGALDALLVSSAGSEGLDLKGTRMVQVMEPHFNAAKIDQVVGRAIRYGSHTHLPEDQRKVEVLRYYSAKNPTFFQEVFGLPPDQSVDRFLKNVSDEKVLIDKELRKVMQRATGPGLEKKSAFGGGIGEWLAIKAAIGAGAHVLQSSSANAALRSKWFRKRVANQATAGLLGKDLHPTSTIGGLKDLALNVASPDLYLTEMKARNAGEAFRGKLKEIGVSPEDLPKNKRELVQIRRATRGDFSKLFASKYHETPVGRAFLHSAGIDPDVVKSLSPEAIADLKKVYKDKSNPLTSNILANITRPDAQKIKQASDLVPGGIHKRERGS